MRAHHAILWAALGAACGGGENGGTEPALVASVTVSPGTDINTFTPGSRIDLTAAANDANGAAVAGKTPTWTTTDATVLKISSATAPTTTVTALATGSAKIIAASEGKADTVSITVIAQVFTRVTILPASKTLQPAGTQQLSASAVDQNGIAMTGTGFGAASYASNNTAVATVNAASGMVTAVASGTTTVTAQIVAGGVTKSGLATITVADVAGFPLSESVAADGTYGWSPSSVDIARGGTVTFSNSTTFAHNVKFSGTGAPANLADFFGDNRTGAFDTPGTFNYNCTIHPGMTGVVIVH